MNRRQILKTMAGVALLATLAALMVRLNAVRLADGPLSIVWDREACGHCKMHIGDPMFAAQLQLRDGHVVNFDDPGCLFEFMAKENPDVHAVYFRDHDGDRWLNQTEAAFLPVDQSPMGYGIKAVGVGTDRSHNWEWAKARALKKRHAAQGAR